VAPARRRVRRPGSRGAVCLAVRVRPCGGGGEQCDRLPIRLEPLLPCASRLATLTPATALAAQPAAAAAPNAPAAVVGPAPALVTAHVAPTAPPTAAATGCSAAPTGASCSPAFATTSPVACTAPPSPATPAHAAIHSPTANSTAFTSCGATARVTAAPSTQAARAPPAVATLDAVPAFCAAALVATQPVPSATEPTTAAAAVAAAASTIATAVLADATAALSRAGPTSLGAVPAATATSSFARNARRAHCAHSCPWCRGDARRLPYPLAAWPRAQAESFAHGAKSRRGAAKIRRHAWYAWFEPGGIRFDGSAVLDGTRRQMRRGPQTIRMNWILL
jgi:hypothetical protein